MVKYPKGRCRDCGEREFFNEAGERWCPNCVQLERLKQAEPEKAQERSSVPTN